MRLATGIFGVVCGLVIIAIVARYGFRTADNEFDGIVWAFLYGTVAFGGLFGHAVSARLWRVNRSASVAVGIVAALALMVNLSNSLGAMAGRSNEKQAGRIKVADIVRDARRDLSRAQDERAAMRFNPTDEASVEAARTASAAASKSREAECAKRGNFCRDREGDERRALEALQSATSGKAATDRAAVLDGEIARLKAQIEAAGPVLDANPQGSAIARLFDLPDSAADWLSTWQSFGMAMIAELLIVVSMIAAELLRKPEDEPQAVAISLQVVEPVEPLTAIAAPSKPRLVASHATPAGNVALIMAELMEPSTGRIEIADAYQAYAAVCHAQGKRAVSAEAFNTDLRRLCKGRIRIEGRAGRAAMAGVGLKNVAGISHVAID